MNSVSANADRHRETIAACNKSDPAIRAGTSANPPSPRPSPSPGSLQTTDRSAAKPTQSAKHAVTNPDIRQRTDAHPPQPTPRPAPPPELAKLAQQYGILDFSTDLCKLGMHVGHEAAFEHAIQALATKARGAFGESFGAGAFAGIAENIGHVMGELKKAGVDGSQAVKMTIALVAVVAADSFPPTAVLMNGLLTGLSAKAALTDLGDMLKSLKEGSGFNAGVSYGKAATSILLTAVGCVATSHQATKVMAMMGKAKTAEATEALTMTAASPRLLGNLMRGARQARTKMQDVLKKAEKFVHKNGERWHQAETAAQGAHGQGHGVDGTERVPVGAGRMMKL